MSWKDKAALAVRKAPQSGPTELTEAPFVGSVSAYPADISQKNATEANKGRAYAILKGRVLALLDSTTGELAVVADDELQPGVVLVAVARRNKFACVLEIDPAKYDGVKLLELIEKHTLH